VFEVQSFKGWESVVYFSDNFPMNPQEGEIFPCQCKRWDVSSLRFTSQQFTSLLNSWKSEATTKKFCLSGSQHDWFAWENIFWGKMES